MESGTLMKSEILLMKSDRSIGRDAHMNAASTRKPNSRNSSRSRLREGLSLSNGDMLLRERFNFMI